MTKLDKAIKAVYQRDQKSILRLIDGGFNVNESDRDGRPILTHAVLSHTPDVKLIEFLLISGADVDWQDTEGWTPLHYASQANNTDLVQLLIKHKAQIDADDLFGNTPLYKAVFHCRGKDDVIRLLIDSGADPDKKNKHGVSPRDLANKIANFDVSHCFAKTRNSKAASRRTIRKKK